MAYPVPHIAASSPPDSAFACSLARAGGRIHAIRLPLDELLTNARDERTQHHPHVGHIPGK